MSEDRYGFIGLGSMGLPMAVNLRKKSGASVIGFNRSSPARERFVQAGGEAAETAESLIALCPVIFLCLPTNDAVVGQVHNIFEKGQPGTIIVDVGSTAPNLIRQLAAEAEEKGMALIDSPVSGGQPGAIAGTLSIMCGGDEATFHKVEQALYCMGSSVVYMGPSGAGSTAKIANNMIVGGHLAAMSEAFALAKKAGLDPDRLFDAIHGGFAQSAVMDAKVPKILARDFAPTARIEIHRKDIDNALALADALGVELPMTKLVEEQMQYLKERDLAKEDQAAMVKYYESQMGVTVSPTADI